MSGCERETPAPESSGRGDAGQSAAASEDAPSRAELLVLIEPADLGTPDRSSIDYPDGAAPLPQAVTLGRQLFFDSRLSGSRALSCATCHSPALGWSDGEVLSAVDAGGQHARHTPHLYNVAYARRLLWDGRAQELDEMSLAPITSTAVMNLPADELLPRLREAPSYERAFAAIYADGLTRANVGKALAAFQRGIVSADSDFDAMLAGSEASMSAAARRGLALFVGKARCSKCHDGVNLSDESFHDIGVETADDGRGKFDGEAFRHAFKTPGLRNVALSAPYMHNGSIGSLAEVIEFYDRGGDRTDGIDPEMQALDLNEREQADLVAFLESLTGSTASAIPGAERPSPPGLLFGRFEFSRRVPRVGLVYFTEGEGHAGGVIIDQKDKAFLSPLSVGAPDAEIEFRNSDSIRHNVFANDRAAGVQFDLGLADPQSNWSTRKRITWAAGKVVEIGCKVHPSMSTYVASMRSRHHAVLDFAGRDPFAFEIDAPETMTQLAVWLPGFEPAAVQVAPGQRAELELRKNGRPEGRLVLGRF